MNCLALLPLLPLDLAKEIQMIDDGGYNEEIGIMKSLVLKFGFDKVCFVGEGLVIGVEMLDELRFALNNTFTWKFNKQFDRKFWLYFLSLMGEKLMTIYVSMEISGANKNSNVDYKNLKMASGLWFKLCQRYDVKLGLCYKNRDVGYAVSYCNFARAIDIKKINNFCKFAFAPTLYFGETCRVDNNVARKYFRKRGFISAL